MLICFESNAPPFGFNFPRRNRSLLQVLVCVSQESLDVIRRPVVCSKYRENALKNHLRSWERSDEAIENLLFMRASAYVELGLCDDAFKILEEVDLLGMGDDSSRGLKNRIHTVRQFGTDPAFKNMMPVPPCLQQYTRSISN